MNASTTKSSPSHALRESQIREWQMDTDVAIVGFGGAGSCAAIEAASAGARVELFEAASAPGGSTALSGGEIYLGGNGGTVLQRKHGFEDSSENMTRYLLMQHGPQADEDKIRSYVDGGTDHLLWLMDQGVPFNDTYYTERTVEPMPSFRPQRSIQTGG